MPILLTPPTLERVLQSLHDPRSSAASRMSHQPAVDRRARVQRHKFWAKGNFLAEKCDREKVISAGFHHSLVA